MLPSRLQFVDEAKNFRLYCHCTTRIALIFYNNFILQRAFRSEEMYALYSFALTCEMSINLVKMVFPSSAKLYILIAITINITVFIKYKLTIHPSYFLQGLTTTCTIVVNEFPKFDCLVNFAAGRFDNLLQNGQIFSLTFASLLS